MLAIHKKDQAQVLFPLSLFILQLGMSYFYRLYFLKKNTAHNLGKGLRPIRLPTVIYSWNFGMMDEQRRFFTIPGTVVADV